MQSDGHELRITEAAADRGRLRSEVGCLRPLAAPELLLDEGQHQVTLLDAVARMLLEQAPRAAEPSGRWARLALKG